MSAGAAPAYAVACDLGNLRTCVDTVCGRPYEEGCRDVDRCHYWSDYPTCLYQPVEPVCVYPYDGGWCVPWHPDAS